MKSDILGLIIFNVLILGICAWRIYKAREISPKRRTFVHTVWHIGAGMAVATLVVTLLGL